MEPKVPKIEENPPDDEFSDAEKLIVEAVRKAFGRRLDFIVVGFGGALPRPLYLGVIIKTRWWNGRRFRERRDAMIKAALESAKPTFGAIPEVEVMTYEEMLVKKARLEKEREDERHRVW